MNITNTVLDRIQKEHGLHSDYATAQLLKVSKQALSKYRNSQRNFDDSIAYRAAKLANMDPYEILASLHKEKPSNGYSNDVWKDMSEMNSTLKQLKTKEYKEAIKALLNGSASNKQKALVKQITEQCILCKIGIISKTATFSPIYQNIPKKHLN